MTCFSLSAPRQRDAGGHGLAAAAAEMKMMCHLHSALFCRRHEEVVVVGGSLVLMVYVPAIGEDMAIISTSLS